MLVVSQPDKAVGRSKSIKVHIGEGMCGLHTWD